MTFSRIPRNSYDDFHFQGIFRFSRLRINCSFLKDLTLNYWILNSQKLFEKRNFCNKINHKIFQFLYIFENTSLILRHKPKIRKKRRISWEIEFWMIELIGKYEFSGNSHEYLRNMNLSSFLTLLKSSLLIWRHIFYVILFLKIY